jgi:hypothetical protein
LWLVDLEAEILSVLRYHESGYISVKDVSPGVKACLEPFSDVEIDTSVLFGGDPED